MIVLSGADVVLPDRVLPAATVAIEDDVIAAIHPEPKPAGVSSHFGLHGHVIVPGFIDVHVHGACGIDTLDSGNPIASLAATMPRFGVTAFCPTTVACAPEDLARVLLQVGECRRSPALDAARVLPAHLESNFISPSFKGAQPGECLRTFNRHATHRTTPRAGISIADSPHFPNEARDARGDAGRDGPRGFDGAEIIHLIERHASDIAIVTAAPELDGGLELVALLTRLGIRAAIGHSGASYETACAAIDAGVSHATHLFNAMPTPHHRAPGLVGAVLERDEVTAELICDTVHVHPTMVRLAVRLKGSSRIIAVSDGTAASGLAEGVSTHLGRQTITAERGCARLLDGTIAGSTLTMDAAFRHLTRDLCFDLVDATAMCATSPARHLGLSRQGIIKEGALADLTVLDADRTVVQTYVGGRLVYNRVAR